MRLVAASIGLFVCLLGSAFAQTAFNPTDVRTFLDSYATSVKGGHITPHWLDDGRFWYVDERQATPSVFLFDPRSSSKTHLVNLSELHDQVMTVLAYDPSAHTLSLATDTAEFSYDLKTKKLTEVGPYEPPSRAIVRRMFPMRGYDRREDHSPNAPYIASLDGPDFLIKHAETGETLVRTDDGRETFQWFHGYDIWEASDEAWSPNGKRFVARSHDMSAIAGIPIVDYLGNPSAVTRFRYWAKVGEPLPITRFAVFDAQQGTKVDVLEGGSEDQFAFFVRWLPDGKRFAFIRYARDLSRQSLVFADAETGNTTTVLSRPAEEGWVKWPSGPVGLQFVPNGKGFLWRSDESGFFHWYHHSMDGKRIRQVTKGDFDAQGIVHLGNDAVFFMGGSDEERPYDQHLLRVDLEGKNQRQLTSRPGQRRALASPDGIYFLLHHESLTTAPNSRLINAKGDVIADLSSARVDASNRVGIPAPEEFNVKITGVKDKIHGIIFKPRDFDPERRYPVVERIYGGMQSQVMPRGFPGAGYRSMGSEYIAMIAYLNAQGFVVVTMDMPGTPGRGRAFNLATHGSWPEGIVGQHAAALRKIAKGRPWMDLSRTGIAGNSFGGTLASYAAARAPDLYKAVSISVPDVDIYDGAHWMEWQLGLQQNNRAGYAGKSAQEIAAQMDSKLLIIAGTSDVNVPISNTMKLLDGLAQAGKPYELVLFPGTNHAHEGRGDRYAYAIARIGQFFQQHLGLPAP